MDMGWGLCCMWRKVSHSAVMNKCSWNSTSCII
jgi:hypothetical protein